MRRSVYCVRTPSPRVYFQKLQREGDSFRKHHVVSFLLKWIYKTTINVYFEVFMPELFRLYSFFYKVLKSKNYHRSRFYLFFCFVSKSYECVFVCGRHAIPGCRSSNIYFIFLKIRPLAYRYLFTYLLRRLVIMTQDCDRMLCLQGLILSSAVNLIFRSENRYS